MAGRWSVRAFRTTLPRFGAAEPVNTSAMHIRRRISATFKDLPGGQVLGSTFDYTHRLLDFMEDPPAAAEQDFPFRGCRYALSGTVQQAASELFLKRADRVAYRRLRDEKLP